MSLDEKHSRGSDALPKSKAPISLHGIATFSAECEMNLFTVVAVQLIFNKHATWLEIGVKTKRKAFSVIFRLVMLQCLHFLIRWKWLCIWAHSIPLPRGKLLLWPWVFLSRTYSGPFSAMIRQDQLFVTQWIKPMCYTKIKTKWKYASIKIFNNNVSNDSSVVITEPAENETPEACATNQDCRLSEATSGLLWIGSG